MRLLADHKGDANSQRREHGSMRVIQAGVGGFGTSWLYAVKQCEGFEHVALVDPSQAALATAGEITCVPLGRRVTRLEEALAKVEAEGLIDVTPAPCHESTSLTAMEAGLHILVEKPISDTMAGALTLVRA